ncbi:MAG: SURF1 family protein [Methylococcaceae bacterium]
MQSVRNYSFKPSRLASLAVLILVVVFVVLGEWQLRRADEKTALMQSRHQKASEPALILGPNDLLTEAHRFRRVVLDGHYDADHQILLDNQIHNQQAGYHVLTPLTLVNSSTHLLINRGWIPLGSDRNILPDVLLQHTSVRISGIVDRFPTVGFKLKGGEIPSAGWPARVLRLEQKPLENRLGYSLQSYQILLDEPLTDGYLRDWRTPDLAPEKSQGYALQWFLFALMTVIIYLWLGFKSGPIHRSSDSSPQSRT